MNNYQKRKRAIIVTDEEQIIFRHDVKLNGKDYIELDMFNALSRMEEMKILDTKVLMNMLKAKHGLNLSDSLTLMKDVITKKGNKSQWAILPDIKEGV